MSIEQLLPVLQQHLNEAQRSFHDKDPKSAQALLVDLSNLIDAEFAEPEASPPATQKQDGDARTAR